MIDRFPPQLRKMSTRALLFRLIVIVIIFACLTQSCTSNDNYFLIESSEAYRTGPRTLTIKTHNKNTFAFSCSSNVHANVTLSFADEVVKSAEDYTVKKSFPRKDSSQGNYSCVINAEFPSLDGHTFSLRRETVIEILSDPLNANPAVCASSAGNPAFRGEHASFFCLGGSGTGWRDSSREFTSRFIGEDLQQYSCGKYNRDQWREACTANNLTVGLVPNLQVVISPDQFSSTDGVLEFTCESSPPRQMDWEIIGVNGNIIDRQYTGDYLEVDTDIAITDAQVGISTLRISESVPGGNGIHTVICFTYDTMEAVAIATTVPETTTAAPLGTGGPTQDTDSPSVVAFIIVIIFLVVAVMVMGGFLAWKYACRRPPSGTKDRPFKSNLANPAYIVDSENNAERVITSVPEYMVVSNTNGRVTTSAPVYYSEPSSNHGTGTAGDPSYMDISRNSETGTASAPRYMDLSRNDGYLEPSNNNGRVTASAPEYMEVTN